MGTPLAPTYRELTEQQRVFVELAIVEYVNEERNFWIQLMGGKPAPPQNIGTQIGGGGTVREAALKRLKKPPGV